MKVSGFTIVRNAIKYDYPVVEAISSILPVCDEVIVAVGRSEDGTLDLIRSIGSPKIRIIETVWDDSLREGGKVLADETNKAFIGIANDSDWCFYIQADEVLHEKYIPAVKEAMQKWKDDKKVEGLLFNYVHFYGSYDHTGDSRRWYKKEIGIVRNDKAISSYKDAQGFRKNEKKLFVKEIGAEIYHYGWVKPPSAQQEKQKNFHKMWHDDEWMKQNIADVNEFDYSAIDSLAKFTGTHPQVMNERLKRMNWKFEYDHRKKKKTLKTAVLNAIEKNLGYRIAEYRNYKILK